MEIIMIKLGNFLTVVGSGELLKIGFRSKNGFKFIGKTIELYDDKEVVKIYDTPIYNIYIGHCDKSIIIILNDRND
jgi:hypothetical protein